MDRGMVQMTLLIYLALKKAATDKLQPVGQTSTSAVGIYPLSR